MSIEFYKCTTGTKTYLGAQLKHDVTNFSIGIGHLMASSKVACATQHFRTFKLHNNRQ